MLVLAFQKIDGLSSQGEIRGLELSAPVPFCGCADLLLKMDRLYDRLEASRTTRPTDVFQEDQEEDGGRKMPSGQHDLAAWLRLEPGRGEAALCVSVRHRFHGSWQGFLYVKGQKVFFRSALEFLRLVDMFLRERTERIGRKIHAMGRMGE